MAAATAATPAAVPAAAKASSVARSRLVPGSSQSFARVASRWLMPAGRGGRLRGRWRRLARVPVLADRALWERPERPEPSRGGGHRGDGLLERRLRLEHRRREGGRGMARAARSSRRIASYTMDGYSPSPMRRRRSVASMALSGLS